MAVMRRPAGIIAGGRDGATLPIINQSVTRDNEWNSLTKRIVADNIPNPDDERRAP